jgi:transposase
MTFLVADSAL